MLILYFSGTGNTRYVAMQFAKRMNATCHSIEEVVDFDQLMDNADTIAIFYPIYGSCVPRIMREFTKRHLNRLDGKRLILVCTQLLFSGDGARVFTELLTGIRTEVIYAEHIRMPSNICNFFLFPVADQTKIEKYKKKADQAVERMATHIKNGKVVKRGFHGLSRRLGLWSQRMHFISMEHRLRKDVRITSACTVCKKCVKVCPMQNLKHENGQIVQNGECTICYRCVNQCPYRAITVMTHAPIKKQYRGIPANDA